MITPLYVLCMVGERRALSATLLRYERQMSISNSITVGNMTHPLLIVHRRFPFPPNLDFLRETRGTFVGANVSDVRLVSKFESRRRDHDVVKR
jgi:hypothetical protein